MAEPKEPEIPVLTDVLVPGNPARARAPLQDAEPLTPADTDVQPVPMHDVPAEPLSTALASSDAAAPPAAAPAAAEAAEPPLPPLPPVMADVWSDADAQRIAERVKSRVTHYLTGEGRDVIESRCRDALRDHASWLVNQLTREVALTLEEQMSAWVKDAVDEELAHRRGAGSTQGR